MTFTSVRAAGGFLTHLLPAGSFVAVCGFRPRAKFSNGRQMKYRHGWHKGIGCRQCKKCHESQVLVLRQGAA